MVKSLTVSNLADRCREEANRYQQTGQSDERYCLELFRLALAEQDQAAWQSIYAQYQPLVAAWVRRHNRFSQTGEEADFFINEAFARLWQFGSRAEIVAKTNSLGAWLEYLRLCAGSAIGNHLRKLKKDALNRAAPLIEDNDRPISEDEAGLESTPPAKTLASPNPGVEGQVERRLTFEELRRVLWATVQDERERLVAEESWVYGLSPRQIQKRYPETFTTAQEVARVKKNLLKRLKRKLRGQTGDAEAQ